MLGLMNMSIRSRTLFRSRPTGEIVRLHSFVVCRCHVNPLRRRDMPRIDVLDQITGHHRFLIVCWGNSENFCFNHENGRLPSGTEAMVADAQLLFHNIRRITAFSDAAQILTEGRDLTDISLETDDFHKVRLTVRNRPLHFATESNVVSAQRINISDCALFRYGVPRSGRAFTASLVCRGRVRSKSKQ